MRVAPSTERSRGAVPLEDATDLLVVGAENPTIVLSLHIGRDGRTRAGRTSDGAASSALRSFDRPGPSGKTIGHAPAA